MNGQVPWRSSRRANLLALVLWLAWALTLGAGFGCAYYLLGRL